MLKLVVVTWRIFTLSQNSSSIFSSYFFCRIQPKYNSSSSSQNVRRRTDAGTSRRRWRRSWGWSRGGSKEININLTSVQNIPISLKNFLKKYFYLYLYLLYEKTVILNTNTFNFKKLSLYEVYFWQVKVLM